LSERGAFLVSHVTTTVQASGALLLAFALAYLARLFARREAALWAGAWAALAGALLSVRAYIGTGSRAWWIVYLVAEWGFVALLYSGCRSLAGREPPRGRTLVASLPAALAVAFVLSRFPASFNGLFAIQAALVSAGFAGSFVALADVPDRAPGWKLMRSALAALVVLFALYVPLFADLVPVEESILGHSSVLDLLLETLLGIGMVLVLSEGTRRELERTVAELKRARDEIEERARVDPLTQVFNRHAFQSITGDGERRAASGVAVMLDVDGLKRINDTEGHAAGDLAIRAVARAVRALVRPEDLLFRWGGDEFLVLLPNLDEATAHERFASLSTGIPFEHRSIAVLFVSWGVARFGDGVPLAQAVVDADAAMYARRARRRGLSPAEPAST
jgi:diguanylate cyclase (GGDEF)-like protein